VFVPNNVYVWFVGHRVLAPLAILFGLPAVAYFVHRRDVMGPEKREVLAVWGIAGVVLLLFVAKTAVLDAHRFNYENCWQIRGNEASSIWECGRGALRQVL
jgi:hypothetical protein